MRKITTLLTLLLTCLTGAMAQEYTIDVGYQNGSFYRQKTWYYNKQNNPGTKFNGSFVLSTYVGTDATKLGTTGGNGDWAYKWEANDASGLTIVANNGTVDSNGTTTNKFLCSAHDNEGNSFQTNGSAITWKISVADGYVITGWKLIGQTETATNCVEKGYVQPDGQTEQKFEKTYETTVEVTGLHTQSTTYKTRASGGTQNAQITWSTFQVTVKKISSTDIAVTYNYKYGDTSVGTEVINAQTDQAFPEPTDVPIGYTATVPDRLVAIADKDATIDVPVTWTLFKFADSFANVTQWYRLRIHTNEPVYIYYDPDAGESKLYSSATDTYETLWAFVGDPINGFILQNFAAGAGCALYKEANQGKNKECKINADGLSQKWFVDKGTAGSSGSSALALFSLYVKDPSDNENHLNKRSTGKLSGYGNNSEGSTIMLYAAQNDYEAFENNVMPFYTYYEANGEGEYLKLTTTAYNENINSVNNIHAAGFSFASVNASLIEGVKYPETGAYRIRSVGARSMGDSYLAYGKETQYNKVGLIAIPAGNVAYDASSVFVLTKVSENVYKLSTQGLYVRTVDANSKTFPMGEGEDEATTFSFVPKSLGVAALRDLQNTETVNNCLHQAGWKNDFDAVVRWSASSGASGWKIEDAELSVNLHDAEDNQAYATFYAPFDATFTGSVTAYTITRGAACAEGSVAEMEPVLGAVPAGTPVVLVAPHGTTSASATVGYGAPALSADNILSGHYLASTVADGSLVFGQYNNVPGFYRYDDYTTVLGANRAYIAPAQANNVRALVFTGGVATGINAATFNANGNAYDLQGRRVQNAQKGLYILNGKKVLVK